MGGRSSPKTAPRILRYWVSVSRGKTGAASSYSGATTPVSLSFSEKPSARIPPSQRPTRIVDGKVRYEFGSSAACATLIRLSTHAAAECEEKHGAQKYPPCRSENSPRRRTLMFNKPHVPSTPSRRFLDPRQCTEHTRSGLSPCEHKCSELRETIQPKNVDKRAQAKRTQCRRRPGDATRQEKSVSG